MPTPTYDLIEEQVLGSAQASVTFSSIPGTYKDLVLEYVLDTSANAFVDAYLNSDTGANYSDTALLGDGTSATSGRNSNSSTGISLEFHPTGSLSTYRLQLMSYSNTNVNKTILIRGDRASGSVRASVGLWRSTAAINTVAVSVRTGNITAGSTFRLWGVAG